MSVARPVREGSTILLSWKEFGMTRAVHVHDHDNVHVHVDVHVNVDVYVDVDVNVIGLFIAAVPLRESPCLRGFSCLTNLGEELCFAL